MWGMQILRLFPQLILVPYLIRNIGESGYGVYVLVWSLLLSIDQLEKSLQSGVVKHSAAFIAQGKVAEVNKIVSSSFGYCIILAIIAFIGTSIAGVLYGDANNHRSIALVIIGVTLLLIIPLTPYIAVIQAKQRYYVDASFGTLSNYVSLGLVIIWFNIVEPSVEALVLIMAAMLFLARLSQVPFAYSLVPGLKNNLRLFNRSSFSMIASFGAATVLASLCLAINSTGVRWLMDFLASTSFIAHMAIMLMPSLLLSQIIGAMTITTMPATSAYNATGNKIKLQELLTMGMRYTMIIVLSVILVGSILMRDLLRLWVGADFEFLAPYALMLLVSTAFMLSTSIAHHMLKGMGKLRTVVFIYLVGLVIVPIGTIFTAFNVINNPYIAVTFGLSSGHVVCGVLQIVFSVKAVNIGWRQHLKYVYGQPLFFATLVFLASLFSTSFHPFSDFFVRLVVSIISAIIFIGGFYLFFATIPERQRVAEVGNLVVRIILTLPGINYFVRK